MKLRNSFREQIGKLGQIRQAWFTTFTLNIPFFETYILPELLHADAPASRMDYEIMQQQLSDDKQIDIRIFCDARALEADQLKRTAIAVHSVLPHYLATGGFAEKSLFHPKVILLQDEQGHMVLGTGSANLGVNGWARNQEAFVFRPVSNSRQYREIQEFFAPLADAARLDSIASRRVKYHGDDHDWRFVHSFQRQVFLKQLTAGMGEGHLSIWSPYLAEDVPGLLDALRTVIGHPTRFSIVPDRRGNRHVPTRWDEQIGKLLADQTLQFHDHPLPRPANLDFTHAKIWLASGAQTRMAIGSWNCTGAGSASLALRNVEAGIMFDVPEDTEIAGAALALNKNDFSTDDMLDKDELELAEYPLPFELNVHFDWKSCCYHIEGSSYQKLSGTPYELRLPGVRKRLVLEWKSNNQNGAVPLKPVSLYPDDDEVLLADHGFEVWHAREMKYRGLVLESGLEQRRGQGYDTLKDLLDDLVDGVEPGNSAKTRLRKALRQQPVPAEEDQELPVQADRGDMSYFRLFHAVEQFRRRLREADRDNLERLLFVSPGCLQEMVRKVNAQIALTGNTVFNWFLVQELRSLHDVAREVYEATRERYARRAPDDHRWESLAVREGGIALPSDVRRKSSYMKQLREVCNYGN